MGRKIRGVLDTGDEMLVGMGVWRGAYEAGYKDTMTIEPKVSEVLPQDTK